jgi:glucokinase-like ROK family protein
MNNIASTADQVLVRKMNRSIIMDCLRMNISLSRAGLAEKTGLNPSTVSNIIKALLEEGLVRETDLSYSDLGRPGRLLELNPCGGCALGVEINVDYISIMLTDFRANIIWSDRIPSNQKDGQERIIGRTEDLISKALKIGEDNNLRPLGIGVGVSGLVDLKTGLLKVASNLKWFDVPIQQIIKDRFNIPVYVENEAHAAALGEYYFGVARGVENFIYLSAGVGLGGGIITNGKLFRGSAGYGGEVGHMTIIPNGEKCACGKLGCWETLIGAGAIARRVQKKLRDGAQSKINSLVDNDIEKVTFEVVLEAANTGDSVAMNALHEVGWYLGIGVANLVNVLNPELVVLGGKLNLASPILLPIVKQMVDENEVKPSFNNFRIVGSSQGPNACALGAVALTLDDILREPM